MGSIELTVRKHLSEEARNSVEGISETRSFCEHVEKGSLNLKVHEALTFRKQGHFDKAMLNIAEANRDQVIAVRKIQIQMGKARDERYSDVVFAKFRQFEPFEIGISDADAVLSILAYFDDEDDPEHKEIRLKLHDCELRKKDEEYRLSFLEGRMHDGGVSEEVDEARESVVSLAQTLMELRDLVLTKIFAVVDEELKEIPPGIEKDRIFLELSRNIFIVVTSPILTKPATDVKTEA